MSPNFPQRPYLPRPSGVAMPPLNGRFVLLPPYAHGRAPTSHAVEQLSAVDEELPSIDDYLDRTPLIEQFAPNDISPPEGDWPSWGGEAATPGQPATADGRGQGAGDTDWRGYDWGSAAQLGSTPPDAAAEAWASTDWSAPNSERGNPQSAAEALARALDQISRRIRAGELRVPGPGTVQDDAAIAATLAALLGIRR